MTIENILFAGLAIAATIMFVSFLDGGGDTINETAGKFKTAAKNMSEKDLW